MDFNKSLKRAKRKQLLIIILLSLVSFIFLLGLSAFILDKIATRNYRTLYETLDEYHTIASPNTQVDSQVITNNSVIGGEVITNQSKNIDGYIVPWGNYRSKYNFLGYRVDFNELSPSWYHSSNNSYEYNRQNSQKYATFYNPTITNYYDGVKNELSEINAEDNYVAEVALSFDKSYKYNDVIQMIPEDVNLVWLFLFAQEREEEYGPSGMPVYGFQLNMDEKNRISDAEADKQVFFDSFGKYFSSAYDEEFKEFYEDNKDKSIEDIEVLGVMITGQAKNLKELADESFVRGSSIGVTAPIVSYITPEK